MPRRVALALAGFAALALTFAGCGGEDDAPPSLSSVKSQTPVTRTATVPAATPTPQIGPSPTLGNYIPTITPGNGQSVTQIDTRSPNPERPRGVCFEADFKDLPETGLWFRMAFDGVEVTEKLVWILSNRENPTGGRACYAPPEGFSVGRHAAAVSVRHPSNPNEPLRQVVAWVFEVTK
ncbi:MAG: hypothetical protein ACKVVT_06375 [Dehalococcoidia bacterium]